MVTRPLEPLTDLSEIWQPPLTTAGSQRQFAESAPAGAGAGAEDLLYGPGVFHKLPEWMTSADADSEDEDDEVPYGQKLNQLLAGVMDDGATTTPPSEPLAELSSSASDDEAGSGTKSPSSEPVAAASSGGRSCSLTWPEAMRLEGCGLTEENNGLVDLDPEEGRRRGAVLLALLAEKPSGSSSEASAREDSPAPLPGAPWRGMDKAAAQQIPPGQQQLGCCWSQGGAKGGLSLLGSSSAGSSPTAAAACTGKVATHALYANVVCEAACRAFGSGAVDVASSASGGFVIWLCGWPALELQRSHQAVLDTLSQALWPYLGQDIMGVEQRTAASAAGSSGARLSGVASAVASTRLTLWCLAEEAKYEQSFCWQYVRSGVCPRGALCRWRHTMPQTYPIDIEVAAA